LEGLSRVENRLKNDLNEVMANSIFLFAQKKRLKLVFYVPHTLRKWLPFIQ